MAIRQVSFEVRLLGVVVDNQPRYELVCLDCGGCEQEERGATGLMAMIYCRACGGWLGRRAALNVKAFNKAREEGYDLDLARFRDEVRAVQQFGRKGPQA